MSELDEVALRIMLSSERGRKWLGQMVERREVERLLFDLQRRGLHATVIRDLWASGNRSMVDEVTALTASQIRALNRAAA